MNLTFLPKPFAVQAALPGAFHSELDSFTTHKYIPGCLVLLLTDPGLLNALIVCFLHITTLRHTRNVPSPGRRRSGSTGARVWATVTSVLHPLSKPLRPGMDNVARWDSYIALYIGPVWPQHQPEGQ